MSRGFRLAGLLRLRDLQEAQAAGRLAAANAGLRDGNARAALARNDAAASAADAASAEELMAIAAARSSSRGMLAELEGLVESLASEAAAAEGEYQEARRRAVVLQKLGERHASAEASANLAREQAALDEAALRGGAGGELRA